MGIGAEHAAAAERPPPPPAQGTGASLEPHGRPSLRPRPGAGLGRRAPGAAPARPEPGPEPSVRLARGKLLVATEQVEGLFFARSVVLLLAHGSEGSLGVVVNRPTRRRLGELLGDEDALAHRDDLVWLGGRWTCAGCSS